MLKIISWPDLITSSFDYFQRYDVARLGKVNLLNILIVFAEFCRPIFAN